MHNKTELTGIFTLLIVATLSACGGGGGNPATNPPAATTDWPLTVDSDPWKATLTTDDALGVAADIPLSGGTLTTTGADGTVYTLTIPADALYEAATITMTPLTNVTGLPENGPTAGVQLGPDGTQFFAPVTLTVQLPAGETWPINQQIPISLEGDDNVAVLAALDPTSVNPAFSILHFSSYVVLLSEKGMNATLSQANVRNRFGGNEEHRLRSAAAELLGRTRQQQLLGMTEGTVDIPFAEMLAEYEEKVVNPRIALAGSSCAASRLAIQTLLGAERQKQLLGLPSNLNERLLSLMDIATEVCMKEEYEICRDEHIITRMLPNLLGISRQYALLGAAGDENTLPAAGLLVAEGYTQRCLQFELQFNSSGTHGFLDPPGFMMSESVASRVKIGYGASIATICCDLPPDVLQTLGLVTGQGFSVMTESGYTASFTDPCYSVDSTVTADDGQLGVSFLTWKAGENTPQTPNGNLFLTDVGISLALAPSSSSYNYTQSTLNDGGCQDPSGDSGGENWSTTVGSALLSDLATNEHGAYATGWQMVNTEIVATKDITLNSSDGGSETTGSVNLVLFHTPMP